MANNSGGIGLLSVLGVVFITLKLTDNIDWAWVWVLAPFWAGVAVVVCVAMCYVVALVATAPFKLRRQKLGNRGWRK